MPEAGGNVSKLAPQRCLAHEYQQDAEDNGREKTQKTQKIGEGMTAVSSRLLGPLFCVLCAFSRPFIALLSMAR
jgi:hypothetical protein